MVDNVKSKGTKTYAQITVSSEERCHNSVSVSSSWLFDHYAYAAVNKRCVEILARV